MGICIGETSDGGCGVEGQSGSHCVEVDVRDSEGVGDGDVPGLLEVDQPHQGGSEHVNLWCGCGQCVAKGI